METNEIEWVLARERPRVFPYFKDRYALLLLAWACGDGRRVRELKQSRFGPLLSKSVAREVAGRAPGGVLSSDLLLGARKDDVQHYRLTLGRWGAKPDEVWDPSWDQTTRPGENIVLQLNFPRDHMRACYGLVLPHARQRVDRHPWIASCHPVSSAQLTLSWARIDVAFDSSEALIEEIQTDWVRFALARARALRELDPKELAKAELYGFPPEVGAYHVLSYVEHVLAPHTRMWAEATLAAALWLLREELGIRRIFMNTFESGTYLKELEDGPPPRSLYSDLPRRFCFQRTRQRPAALRRCRHPEVRHKLTRRTLEWFLLEL